MNIVVLGAGVQGTLYAVRLAQAGHAVTLIARGRRAAELQGRGAVIRNEFTGRQESATLPVQESLRPDLQADCCIVTVRREQLDAVVAELAAAPRIARIVLMVNHASGPEAIAAALGRERLVLAFPGAAGSVEGGVVRYVEVAEQPTVVDARAADIVRLLRGARFKVAPVADMSSWLSRHAVFVSAICGAIYEAGGDAPRLGADGQAVRRLVLAVREGWAALDVERIGSAPLALRAIFNWVPLPFPVRYWARLLASPRGELYFARHARHAPQEMAALAADVMLLARQAPMPQLRRLYAAIDRAAAPTAKDAMDRAA